MPSFPPPTQKFDDFCDATVTDLIDAYRESIDMLRKECRTEIEAHKAIEKADPNFGDDLFLLRYVLSHHKKGLEKAKTKLIKTMAWRRKYADLLLPLRRDLADAPHDGLIRQYMASGLHYLTKDGHPVFIIRSGVCNPHSVWTGLEKMLSDRRKALKAEAKASGAKDKTDSENESPQTASEILVDWLTLTKECAHAYCDARTRQLNRLIKIVVVQDCNHVTMYSYHHQVVNAIAASSHISEGVYPQLMRKSIIVNLPALCRLPAQVALKLMPQGLQDKIAICSESNLTKIALYISNAFNIEVSDLPSFLGGECRCPRAGGKAESGEGEGFCCGNTPNDLKQLLPANIPAEGYPSWKEDCESRLGLPRARSSKANGVENGGYVCSLHLQHASKSVAAETSSTAASSPASYGLSPSTRSPSTCTTMPPPENTVNQSFVLGDA